MKVKLFTALSALLSGIAIYAGDIDNSYYNVDVSIVPAEKVDKIELKACPVYDNKKYAFTMRWDDNRKSNFRMQSLMHKYGFKGTFYLIAQKRYDYKKICQKGTDAGSHSMTHPHLPSFNSNKIFQEAVEIKPFLESRTDKPINTYCFSYGVYHNRSVPETGHWIAESLQRAGYHFNTYVGFVDRYCKKKDPVSSFRQIEPGDKNPSLARFERALVSKMTNPKYKSKDPNIGIGVHVWMNDDAAWNNMESILKKYSGRKAWWYCTQTDYAAYRKLYKLCKITRQKKNGNAVEYNVVLPYASDIGSDIQLTMCFNGKVACIKVNGKNVAVKYTAGKSYFNISPPSYAKIPAVISYARNKNNTTQTAKISKTRIKPWLSINNATDELKLVLNADKADTITDIKIKYILPLMYKHIRADKIKGLSDGKKIITKQLKRENNSKLSVGTPFLLCQVDYLADGKPERAYASTFGNKSAAQISNCFRDKSLISNLFGNPAILKDKLCELSKSGVDKTGLKWFKSTDESRAVYNEDTTSISGRLKGKDRKFSKKSPFIAIRYSLDSRQDTELNISKKWQLRGMEALFVNGKEIPKEKMSIIKIRKGQNHIIMVNKLRWLYTSLTFHYAIKI
jgi:hypothetical protein